MKLAVLASGRGSNLQAIMEAIDRGQLQARIALVISNNPSALALERAHNRSIPTRVLLPADFPGREDYDLALAEEIGASGAEWVVLAGFMRLLTGSFIERFPGRVVNIHPSLLPAFPGLEAQHQAVEYGVKYSGCTVHLVDEDLDHGPIIAQRVVPVNADDNAETLAARILVQEHELFPKVLQLLGQGKVRIKGRRAIIEPLVQASPAE